MILALLLALLAAPARALPDNIWSHINTACTIGQVPIKSATNSWGCGYAVDASIWRRVGTVVSLVNLGDSLSLGALTLTADQPLNLSGAGGTINTKSSATAAAFFGDGAHLTGIPSTGSIVGVYLPLTGGTLSGSLTGTSFFGSGASLTGIPSTGSIVGVYLPLAGGGTITGSGVTLIVNSSATVLGQLNIGWEMVTNACGAGVTTCTASCSANKVVLGCGECSVAAVLGVSVTTGGTSSSSSCTCTALTATTITAVVYCGRLGS